MGSAIEHLHDETEASREALAGAAFFAAVDRGELSRDGYVSYLRVCRTVFSAVEEIAAPSLRRDGDLATPRIERDLAALDVSPHRVLFDAELRAVAVAQDLAHEAMAAPGRTAGYLFALAGALPGGAAQRERLAWAAGIAGPEGTAFLRGAADEGARRRRIGDALRDPRALAEAVAGARAMLDALRWIVDALPPSVTDGERCAARNLNPDAGTYAVADDPRELQAAVRASERTWREHPYYARRYGERARRFIRSDSAWLVTLARSPADALAREVAWLARVLAARGMPTLLLERHLFALHDALVAAVPERAGLYAALATAARGLRARRREAVPDARALECARRVDLAAGAGLQGAGELIAGAVADERNGHHRAVSSLTAWLTDPERFGEEWARAVLRAVADARGPRAGVTIDYGSTEIQTPAG